MDFLQIFTQTTKPSLIHCNSFNPLITSVPLHLKVYKKEIVIDHGHIVESGSFNMELVKLTHLTKWDNNKSVKHPIKRNGGSSFSRHRNSQPHERNLFGLQLANKK